MVSPTSNPSIPQLKISEALDGDDKEVDPAPARPNTPSTDLQKPCSDQKETIQAAIDILANTGSAQ